LGKKHATQVIPILVWKQVWLSNHLSWFIPYGRNPQFIPYERNPQGLIVRHFEIFKNKNLKSRRFRKNNTIIWSNDKAPEGHKQACNKEHLKETSKSNWWAIYTYTWNPRF
jgi:hypothetical protein